MFIFVEKNLVTKYKPGHRLFLQKITFGHLLLDFSLVLTLKRQELPHVA